MDRASDQPFDLPGNHQPQQHAENQDAEAGSERAGVERHRQFAAGYQQQMTRLGARAGQGNHLVGTKFSELPGFDVPVTFRQVEFVAVLQLRQPFAFAVIQGGGAQW